MKFTPETYKIPDIPMQPFIDEDEIWEYLHNTVSTKKRVREVIAKSLSKQRLNLEKLPYSSMPMTRKAFMKSKKAPNSSKKPFTAIASYSSHPYM